VVFTVPAEIADIAFQNKTAVYDLLFQAASETMVTIAADPRHLGVHIGITAVLHTWGSAMTHHPHIHMIVPGGGLSLDRDRWVSSGARFLLPVRVLAKLFRRLFLARLQQLQAAGRLRFFGDHAGLSDRRVFLHHLAPLRKKKWVVYAKPPFAGPEAVLAYLSHYTHRVAISNRRLITFDETGVTFRYKDYRRDGVDRQRTMTLRPDEFIRRFLLHVLPKGFHRIRHYGLLASAGRKANVALARAACGASTGRARRTRSAIGSAPAMPMLRRSHGRHRDLPAWRSSARAAGFDALIRNGEEGVVIRRDEPLSTVEAVPLRPSRGRTPRSTASSTAMPMTATSAGPPPRHRLASALTDRPSRPLPAASGRLQSLRYLRPTTEFLKSP
jgi:hypothetical protein